MEKISIDKAIATSAAPSAMEGYCMIAFGGLAERFFHLHTLFIVTVIQALLGFNSVCRFFSLIIDMSLRSICLPKRSACLS